MTATPLDRHHARVERYLFILVTVAVFFAFRDDIGRMFAWIFVKVGFGI